MTPHLGGGVGKAISVLVSGASRDIKHSFIILEKPQKKQFLEIIVDAGCNVQINKEEETIRKLISNADIVHLDWWSHPATFKFLCMGNLSELRLLVWCHVSGLHNPLIPTKLIQISNKFIFTTECSYQADNITHLDEKDRSKLGVVSSGVGFSEKVIPRNYDGNLPRIGFMGSINSSKLHPQFINYLSAVSIENFKVHIWSDDYYKDVLLEQCNKIGKPDLIEFHGYILNPIEVLRKIDVFVYLLNPSHYGTAENVLLEAMSLGAVPIVINNPAETRIVDHKITGFVVNNSQEFAETVKWITENPTERKRISNNASKKISEHYTHQIMTETMEINYNQLMNCQKQLLDFRYALGNNPYEWFMACQDPKEDFRNTLESINSNQIEETKGSLKHFLSYFPEDNKLKGLYNNRHSSLE